ncbi:MAG: electron transport complex subunit E [Clostridium sp.]|nr:electron transport complex subunit E [Clostridium sp.]
MNKTVERLYCGMVKENPTFVQMLGMCPTMAVTTSALGGLGMGLTTTVVLVLSNMMISALRKVIPDKVRIPAYIVIIASFVTIVQFLLQGFIPTLYDTLGIYIPLIVVNCIILGRAESFASKNNVWLSMFDGIGMGLGFTVGLTSIGIFRELFGNGTIFNIRLMPEQYEPVTILILAPGAFFVLACLIAVQNKIKLTKAKNADEAVLVCAKEDGCAGCTNTLCGGKTFTTESIEREKEET